MDLSDPDPHAPEPLGADEPVVEQEGREETGTADRGRTGALGRDMPVAIASGLVLVALFLGTLFWSPWAFLAFVGILIVVALFELDVAFRAQGLRPATPVAVGAGMVMFFGSYADGPNAQSLGLVLLVLGTLAWTLLDPAPRTPQSHPVEPPRMLGAGRVTANVGATCLMTIWVPFLASFIGLLLLRPDGAWAVMATVALAVTNDIGAFAFGTKLGRRKLAPSVSPGKTWEGFAGGIATALVIAALITSRVPGFDLPSALLLALGVSVAGTLGDLAESLVKRDLGVKDLGRLIPGHGGIMDRVDAIIFALPVAYLVLAAVGD